MKFDDYYSSTEAMELLGCAASTRGANLSALARAGRIPGAVKAGSQWFYPRAWVDAERLRKAEEAGQPRRGRPRKK